jgi:hypothetical protein
MAKPFYLIWQEGTTVLEGYDGANWIDGQLTFPIVFPGITTTPLALSLSSSASVNLTFETLINVAFYLTGSDAPTVQGEWPYITDAYGNATASVTGGVEISFDNGLTWNRFSNTVGLESTPLHMAAASSGSGWFCWRGRPDRGLRHSSHASAVCHSSIGLSDQGSRRSTASRLRRGVKNATPRELSIHTQLVLLPAARDAVAAGDPGRRLRWRSGVRPGRPGGPSEAGAELLHTAAAFCWPGRY